MPAFLKLARSGVACSDLTMPETGFAGECHIKISHNAVPLRASREGMLAAVSSF